MSKDILLFGLALLCYFRGLSQQPIHRVLPGDKLPSKVLERLNHEIYRDSKYPRAKPDLILLDFWDISCSICVSSMPKLDSMQRKFGNKISIILITRNSASEVRKLFSHLTIPKPRLHMITGDSILCKYFPHSVVPHHVWIDNNYTVRYISDGYNTTCKNIERFLYKDNLKLHFKQDEEDFDFLQPLIAYHEGELLRGVRSYSALTKKVEQFGGGAAGLIFDTIMKQRGVKLINTTLLELFKTAFGEAIGGGRFASNNRVLLEVSDPGRFLFPQPSDSLDIWENENLYTYELRKSTNNFRDVFATMRLDLAQNLPYSATVEDRLMMSYVLQKIPGPDLLKTKSPTSMPVKNGNTFINVPFKVVLDKLENLCSVMQFPFASEFTYDGNVDVKFSERPPGTIPTISWLRENLRKYGLDLVEKNAIQEMLIIHSK